MFSLSSRSSSESTLLCRKRRLAFESLEARLMLHGGHERDAQRVDRIINGDPTNDFESVGIVGDQFGGFCSGTLIAPRFVLTAAHCVSGLGDTQARFRVEGTTYASADIFIHSQPNRNDIAIIKLNQAVSGVDPSPIFRGIPQVGDELTLVGYGAGGDEDGHDGDFGTKRVGTTPIDEVTQRLIIWFFDNVGEGNTAPGDSGGPAYLLVGGEYQIAGITSGGTRADAGFGDESFDTRVDFYQDWIDNIVDGGGGGGGGGQDDHGDTFADATPLTFSGGRALDSGVVEDPGDLDMFSFVAPRTERIVGRLNRIGNFDPMLSIFDDDGDLIAFNDDYRGLNSRVSFQVLEGEKYYAQAEGYSTSTGEYNLKLVQKGPGGVSELSAEPSLSSRSALEAAFASSDFWLAHESSPQNGNSPAMKRPEGSNRETDVLAAVFALGI